MHPLSRQIIENHSLFLWYCAALIAFFSLTAAPALSQAPEPEHPVLHIYTEVRDGSQLLYGESGNVWVENDMSRLVEAVMEESGLAYQVTVVPWSRMLNTLTTEPNSLAYPLIKLPAREDDFRWVGFIRPIDSYLFGLRGREQELPTTLEAARNYRIGSMRGDAFHNYFSALEFPNLVIFGNNTPWLSMLERSRIDLMPFALSGIDSILQRNNRPADTLIPAVKLDALSFPLYFVMNLNSDPELVEVITVAYRRVVQNGTFERIMGLPHPEF
jgi:polar amino acid transport system substrate-binding protein